MGTIGELAPEKLVIAVLISEPRLHGRLADALLAQFGPVDFTSEELDFSFTRYYDREMGSPIRRFFLSFERLVPPETLAEIKAATNRIEDALREEGRRKVNLDPGLLSASRFILASTKDSSHRVPLKGGIYAEVTLVFERGEYRALEWTYPDYRSLDYRRILGEIRRIYRRQILGGKTAGPPSGRKRREPDPA